MGGRNVYLSSKDLDEAVQEFFESLEDFFKLDNGEEIDTALSIGRITAHPVFARISSPHFNASAMDGIALDAATTFGATERNRLRLKEGRDYVVVDTGDPIPSEYNAVIMVEDLVQIGPGEVEITSGVTPWQNIRPIGEDIVQEELIIPSYHRIRPVDIGAMLAGGVNSVQVIKKPRVAIIPTGTELVQPGQQLKPGDLVEYNSYVFAGLIEEWGGQAFRMAAVPDDYKRIKETVDKCVRDYDMVIINAGSSAGREDFTKDIVQELGQVLAHGLAIKPGKPAILGKVTGKPVVGIPGYPVSAYIVMEKVIKPLILGYLHQVEKPRATVTAISSRRIVSSLKNREFVRVKLGRVGGRLIATPLTRGAGVMMSLVRADGMLVLPQNSEGVDAGEQVTVELMKDLADIENTIVCIGSHDMLLDVLANDIHRHNPRLHLASAHVGSMGGIMALKKGEAHIAGVHLMDADTGEYNLSYIRKYLKDKRIALIKMVGRVQGFMVKKGNPKGIRSFNDLTREDVSFVNRQRGSGTRILLDFFLDRQGIDAGSINGYNREEYTHMAVAAAVAFTNIDVGLGVYSSAAALGLDFIPIYNEEYDLAIPTEFLEEDNIKIMLKVIRSSEFRKKIEALKGYNVDRMGEVVFVD
jgi:putative molybdopterin biosynthesis protein